MDPGIRGSGVALFDTAGRLRSAAYVRNPQRAGNRANAAAAMAKAVYLWMCDYDSGFTCGFGCELAVEWMRVYASRLMAGDGDVASKDPNDLLPLAAIAGGIEVLMGDAVAPASSYTASEWKGQMKKPACYLRATEERLGADEMAVLSRAAAECSKDLFHNVMDAVCIGLHHVGRGFVGTQRRRVYPGARDA